MEPNTEDKIINETAKKIKSQKLAETIIGLAVTGSFSGFEVISEV